MKDNYEDRIREEERNRIKKVVSEEIDRKLGFMYEKGHVDIDFDARGVLMDLKSIILSQIGGAGKDAFGNRVGEGDTISDNIKETTPSSETQDVKSLLNRPSETSAEC